jgi:nickel/cobalt transporter (NicO) family protein
LRRLRRVLIASVLGICGSIAVGGPAAAHPLGNFSINRFSGIEVTLERVVVHYAVDMAEVPTFQASSRIDTDDDDGIEANELDAYAAESADEIRSNISLSAGGEVVRLSVEDVRATLRSGQGGLDLLRMEFVFAGVLPQPETRLEYEDANYPEQLGWKEIIAYGTGGQGVAGADVPSDSNSDALRSYPRDLLSSPPDVTTATVDVSPGAEPAATSDREYAAGAGSGDPLGEAFSSLIERDLSAPFLLFAALLAIAAGGLHALGPGHGKTVMAAYLVGTNGRARHALAVGIAISLMHTASVIGLCLITLWAQSLFPPEAVYPWLSLVSGSVVLVLGAWLLWTRLQARRLKSADHDHTHESHTHSPASHSHGGSHHTHGPSSGPGHSPLSWRGLVALALSGGLLPSPTALVVLLGAVALHRTAFGFALVLCFSIGLAGALTLIGMLVLRAREFASSRLGRSPSILPILSAAAIFAMGLFLTSRAAIGF